MILLGLVVLIAYSRLDRREPLNRIFLTVSLIIVVQLLFETLTCIINRRPELWLIPISVILHVLLFIANPILTYFWHLLVKTLVGLHTEKGWAAKGNILLLIPVLVSSVLALLSPVYRLVFYISSDNVYHRGPYFSMAAAITFFYVVYGLILIVKNRSRMVKEEFIPLCIFGIFPIIGGLVQTLYYGPLLMLSGTAFSLVIVYIFLQQRMVHLDPLTGAWNRQSFDYYISQRLRQKDRKAFALIYLDIDWLKRINDQYGHAEGDFAIKTAIAIIKGIIRKSDIVARVGGDEFIIVLDAATKDTLEKTIRRISAAFAEYNAASEKNPAGN
jgi:diguanylate cyclase (GGDEF)-like protein